MAFPKIGDRVEIVFLDHSEGPEELAFRVVGIVNAKDRNKLVVDVWCPADDSHDDAEGFNRQQYSILRKAIKELYILKRSS